MLARFEFDIVAAVFTLVNLSLAIYASILYWKAIAKKRDQEISEIEQEQDA